MQESEHHMSDEHNQEQNQEQSETTSSPWSPPDPREIGRAITTALDKRPKKITRTIICKLHNPSRRKVRALLWAQVHVTNMTAHILEALRETPGEVRNDKALAFIREVYARKARGHPSNRTVLLANILATAFNRPRSSGSSVAQAPDTEAPADEQQPADEETRSTERWEPPAVPPIQAADYPVTSHLRTGAYRETATMLINWYIRLLQIEDRDTEETSDEQSTDETVTAQEEPPLDAGVPDIAAVHQRWAAKRVPYEAARETIVPFGRHRGKTLAEVGKREVRWLRERLIPEAVARETLTHIEVLLHEAAHQHNPARIRQARQARHPWRRQTGQQRRTRVNRAFQRSLDVRQPLIRLQTLNEEELLNLQSELEEMAEFATQFETIRRAVDVFLRPAPASYPNVQALRYGSSLQAWRETYETAIEALRLDVFEADQEGADTAMQTFQTVAGERGRPHMQPLAFKRPMQPGVATFALLFSRSEPDAEALERKYGRMTEARRQRKIAQVLEEGDLYAYVLAVVVHGREAFGQHEASEQHNGTDTANRDLDVGSSEEIRSAMRPPERFEPIIHPEPALFYVNYPHTRFHAPRGTSLLLFPLEFGEAYQERTFLRQIIERQRIRQEESFTAIQARQRENHAAQDATDQTSGDAAAQQPRKKVPESVAEVFPQHAPLGSARILSSRNDQGYRECYIHLPVEDQTVQERRRPNHIIGFHEHASGYSYALLDFQGGVQRVGDVRIPPHVLPKEGDRWYSDNYAFETVKAMIDLTRLEADGEPDALIGLENAAWKKQRTSLSREQNRQQFARPSAKIASILNYKAAQVGLVRPHDVRVSPNRCSVCNAKRDASIRNTYPHTQSCATCGSTALQETEPGSGELACTRCSSIWQEYEPWFLCPTCGHQHIARLNTAVVVARYALTNIVSYWSRARQTPESEPR
jgi:predicted RNA-binding Zn-ribbon protein involved in translation (DUF1610 family)